MKSLVACAALLSLSVAASAADLSFRPSYSPVYDWNGFYVGGNAGYASGSATARATLGGLTLDTSDTLRGPAGGVQAGYNWHSNALLLGVEGDIQASGQRDRLSIVTPGTTAALVNTVPWFATLRGRIGVTADQWLLYGTGGLAVSELKSVGTSTIAGVTTGVSAWAPQAAWTLGGGVETALWNSRWTGKLEYLYISPIDLTSASLGSGAKIRTTNNVVRIGVNYRFGGN